MRALDLITGFGSADCGPVVLSGPALGWAATAAAGEDWSIFPWNGKKSAGKRLIVARLGATVLVGQAPVGQIVDCLREVCD
jgi:hypothetical protein